MTEIEIQKIESEVLNNPSIDDKIKNDVQILIQHIRNITLKKSCKHGHCKSKSTSADTVVDAEPFKE